MLHAHVSSVFLIAVSLRHLHSLLLPHLHLSDHPVLPTARQLQLPRCGGQLPCALPLRTLAPRPRTSLPQVMSPTTTSSQRLTWKPPRSPRASNGTLMTSNTMTSPSARRSLTRAEDEPITLKKNACRPVCRGQSVMRERGDPLFAHLVHKFRAETQRHNSESEQIRTLLERQREQILADCQAEIRKHDFQADYNRRSIQKLNETIESQEEEICRAQQGDERRRQDHQLIHEQLLMENWDLREAHETACVKWKN